jgi:murein DD-endopeptidase MepM/ murein hydrolase activator NlpD
VGASSFGTVKHVGYSGASGNLVLVEHASDVETGYAHLSRFAEGLKVGDKVKRTEVVGYVGSTGRSTGPHLHFSVKKKGEFVDPETLNFDAMRVLPPEERSLFAEVRARYDKLLEAIELPPLPAVPEPPLAKADPAADPGLEDHPVETFDDPLATAPATAKPAAPQALAAAPQPAAPKPASATGKPNAVIYMTDEELLKLQPLRDSDEVR